MSPLAAGRRAQAGERSRPAGGDKRAVTGTEARAILVERLRLRQPELEERLWARIDGVSGVQGERPPEYVDGLRAAVPAALEFALSALETARRPEAAVPPALLVQARLAARSGVGLDVVLRRYIGGYFLLVDFLIEEAEGTGLLEQAGLKRLLRTHAPLFDRLVEAVCEEYRRDEEQPSGSRERVELVERLLRGELLEAQELTYDFEGVHLAVVAQGEGALRALKATAGSFDRRLLAVPREDNGLWAWLGGRRELDRDAVRRTLAEAAAGSFVAALGEPMRGLAGWRLSHEQARAALPVARSGSQRVVAYGDVALIASMLQDKVLATSVRQLYLTPLERDRDGGHLLRQTLRAYGRAERNISSTAAALGVNRKTVAARLATVESLIGRPLGSCIGEVEAALRLEELEGQDGQIIPVG
jgi:diguanylate cyclase with GGDEF domain/PucR-like helix-turn-helix protein